MWDRTITVCSAGKTFSVTGWKLGWAYGPDHLMRNLFVAHQNALYTCATPTQEAVARGLEIELERLGTEQSYFKSLAKQLESKRDFMAKFLVCKFMDLNETGHSVIVIYLADGCWNETHHSGRRLFYAGGLVLAR